MYAGHTCVYTKLTFRLHHARHSSFIFTALWCGCSFIKLAFYLHHTPPFWLWLVCTTVQIMPGLHRITNTCQVREYPDFTISKVLTVLKWKMIMTFNRKLLEKQRVENHFASYEVYIGHFFLQCQILLSVLEIVKTCLHSDFKFFSLDRLTDWQTEKMNCLTSSQMRTQGNYEKVQTEEKPHLNSSQTIEYLSKSKLDKEAETQRKKQRERQRKQKKRSSNGKRKLPVKPRRHRLKLQNNKRKVQQEEVGERGLLFLREDQWWKMVLLLSLSWAPPRNQTRT